MSVPSYKMMEEFERKMFPNGDCMDAKAFRRFDKQGRLLICYNTELEIKAYLVYNSYKHSLRIYSVASIDKGYGKAFIGEVERLAKEQGKAKVTLECRESLVDYYSKLGYTVTGKVNNYYADQAPCYKMQKYIDVAGQIS